MEDNGSRVIFRNVLGSMVEISERNEGVYKLSSISHDLVDVHSMVAPRGSYCNRPLLTDGVVGKEEAIRALTEMLESLGYRIIK